MISKRILVVTFTLLALAAGSSAWAQQYARPDLTLDPGGFSPVGGPATLHEALITAGTSEYIDSGVANPTTAQLSLSSVDDPGVGTGHILRFNCKVEGGKGPETCDVALYDGGTLIYSVSQQPTARGVWETFAFTLLDTEANNISEAGYANLSVYLTAGISNKAGDGDSAQFSWVELEVPAPATTTPSVTTNGAPVFTQNQATLGGNVSSDGGDALLLPNGVGIYLHTATGAEAGTRYPMTTPAAPYPKDFSGTIGSLLQGTTYYYKAYAENSIGETIADNEVSFTTWDVPTLLATPTVDNVQLTSATLGGTVTSDGGTTVTACGVTWGTTSGAGPYTNSASAASCATDSAFTIDTSLVGPLETGTTYYFRSYATNAVGTAHSAEEGSFVPSGPPQLVASVNLGSVTDTQALLGGNITDNGGAAITAVGIYWDTIGIDPRTDGNHVPMTVAEPSFEQLVTGLTPGSTIYFLAYATNGAGTTDSTIINFDTDPGAPTMDPTPTVANIVGDGADLGGTMISHGGGTGLDCGVQLATAPGGPYGPNQSFGVCTAGSPFAVSVSGLTSGLTYYFRAYATSAAGSDYSDEDSFIPQASPVVTSTPAANPTHNSADLGGTVVSDEGSPVTERGIVWDLNPGPEGQETKTTVPMGSGIGAFSQTVSLPSGKRIYFEAYATNSAGTSYSNDDRFVDTATQPTVQASGLVLTPFGRSIRAAWTRGNGDGSLVAVWQNPPNTIDAPVDLTDYIADPDYSNTPPPPETSTNSGNFVVYKGSNNTILVTGLDLNTTYHFAVYEYAGEGTNSDYIQTSPATDFVATTDLPQHNYDYRVNCEECHKHGTQRPRQAELENKCKTCHDAGGLASTKREFKNHLLPNRNPGIDYVDCGMCHELHKQSSINTTRSVSFVDSTERVNKSFLRANVGKYVDPNYQLDKNAWPKASLHAELTDQPKREEGNLNVEPVQAADTPQRAVEGGNDTTARGYCQVCHTLTAYHRSNEVGGASTVAGYSKNGFMQCHDGSTENAACATDVNCGDCHEHNNSFIGVNNNLPCEDCHNAIQGSRPIITTQFDTAQVLSSHIPNGTVSELDCKVCHDQSTHTTGFVRGLDVDDIGDPPMSWSHPAARQALSDGIGEVYEPHCLSCHDDGVADNLPTDGGAPTAGQTQNSPFINADSPPIIDPTAWSAAGHNRPSGTFPTSPVSCMGDGVNGCHGSGHGSQQVSLLADAAGPTVSVQDFCINCHDGAPASTDIPTQFASLADGTTLRIQGITSKSGATPIDNYHDTSQVSCPACHSPHVDNTSAASPVLGDPDNSAPVAAYSPLGSYNEDGKSFNYYDTTGDLDPVNPEGSAGGFTEPDYIQFCLTCHDGTTPPGVTMTASMTNMADAYSPVGASSTDVHGSGAAAGNNGSTNKGGMKVPWVTSAAAATNQDPTGPYSAINCNTCHGAHGTGNIFNLRTSITVGGVQLSVGGVGANAGIYDPARNPDPTVYTLPPINGRNVDPVNGFQNTHYWGAWCSFCHKMDGHPGKVESDSCTNGHMHGGGAF